jgi:hypothetical protein
LVYGSEKVKMNIYSPNNRRDTAVRELVGEPCSYDTDGDVIVKWRTPEGGQPSEADIEAKVAEYEAEWDAQEYARNRQAEFPSIQDLVVALYDTDDKSAVEAKRASVKLKYPKPS